MKRIIAFCSILCMLITSVPTFAQSPIAVTLNEKPIAFDQPPVIINDRTMVPIRAVCEALGADVYWIAPSRAILIVKNSTKLLLAIEDAIMLSGTFSGEPNPEMLTSTFFAEIKLDAPPQIIGDRTLLPIRAVCEALGAEVFWNADSRTVELTCSSQSMEEVNRDKTFIEHLRPYEAFLVPSDLQKMAEEARFSKSGTLTLSGFRAQDSISETTEYVTKMMAQEETKIQTIETKNNTTTVTFRYTEHFSPDAFLVRLREKRTISFREPDGKMVIDNSHVQKVTTQLYKLTNTYTVAITLTEEGTLRFSEATERVSNLSPDKNYIDIYVNDALISRPTVSVPIYSETLMISGGFSELAEAEALMLLLTEQRLPDHITATIE